MHQGPRRVGTGQPEFGGDLVVLHLEDELVVDHFAHRRAEGEQRTLESSVDLGSALKQNPSLQVFVACGYHDLATPPEGIEHSIRHMDLPQELRGNFHFGYYDGGHMMYTALPSLKRLSEDLTGFLKKSLN